MTIPFSDQVFQKLGSTITATDSTMIVQLSNLSSTADNDVVADAVYIMRRDPVSTTTYDQVGRVTQATDANGNATAIEYDELDRPTTTMLPDPDGAGVQAAPANRVYYNKAGQVIGTIAPDLRVQTSQYDGVGRSTASYMGAIIDNSSVATRYSESGTLSWADDTDGFLGLSRTTTTVTGTATATAQWTFDGLVPDEEYEVYATWTADATASVTYKLYQGSLSATPTDVNVNQSYAPGENAGTTTTPIAFSDQPFQLLGTTFTAEDSQLIVTLSNSSAAAGETVVADAIYLLKKSPLSQTLYDRASRVVASIDAQGYRTDYTYDNMGRLIETALPDPDGDGPLTRPRTRTVYDANSQVIETFEYSGETLANDQRACPFR